MKRPHQRTNIFQILLGTVGIFLFFVFASATIFFSPAYSATPPSIVTYQGKLLENGSAVTSTKSMSFLLYDSLTGGSLLYTASGTLVATSTVSVTPSSGIFAVDIGDTAGSPVTNAITSSIFANNASVYLEVWVGGTQLSPRKRLTSAPYALNAQYLMGATTATNSTSQHIVVSDTNGNFTFAGTPQDSSVSGGAVYINPANDVDKTLFGIASGGNERFRVDNEGDTTIAGDLSVSSTFFVDVSTGKIGINSTSPDYALTVSGTSHFNATTTVAGLLDVSGKVTNPTVVGSLAAGLSLSAPTLFSGGSDLVVQGNYAYVAGSSTFYAIDVSDPTSPTLAGSFASSTIIDSSENNIAIRGRYAYVVAYNKGIISVLDISNPASPAFVSSNSQSLQGTDIVLYGNYAFVPQGMGGGGVEIYDISNPEEITLVASPNSVQGTNPQNIAVRGKYLYFGTQNGSLYISDSTDPTNIAAVSEVNIPLSSFNVDDIFISGKYVYALATSDDSLSIIDISDPASATTTGSIVSSTSALLDGAASVFVSDEYAYVASQVDDALAIIDVSTPSSPTAVGSVTHANLNGASRVYVQGRYAYVLGSDADALVIIDLAGAKISNSSIGNAEVSNLFVSNDSIFDSGVHVRGGLSVGASGLLVSGDLAIGAPSSTANSTNTFRFANTGVFMSAVSSTDSSAFEFDTRNTLTGGNLLSVRNNGTLRFVIDESGNVGINTSTPVHALGVVGSAFISNTTTLGSDLIVAGDVNIDSGTFIVDVTNNYVGINTTSPQYALSVVGEARITATTTLSHTIVNGNLTVDTNTLVVDATNNRVGINTTSPQYSLSVDGTARITATTTIGGSVTIEGRVKDPVWLSTTDMGVDPIFGMDISGDYAYLARNTDGLTIVDISNPESIVTTTDFNPAYDVSDVVVTGNYAYVGSGGNVFAVLDISNPKNVFTVATTTIAGSTSVNDLVVSGNYAYADGNDEGLIIIDISDPATPFETGRYITASNARDVKVQGRYAYVTNVGDGLRIIDVSDPLNPVSVSVLSMPNFANINKIYVVDQYAFVTWSFGDNGVGVIDISDPTDPKYKGSYDPAGSSNANNIFVRDNYLYIAGSPNAAAFQVVEMGDPLNPTSTYQLVATVSGQGSDLIELSGKYAYLGDGFNGNFSVIDLSGADITNADIGGAKIATLEVNDKAKFNSGVYVRNGLTVGNNGLLVGGDIGIFSNTTTASATNTIRFSDRVLFKTSAAGSQKNLFIFDTYNDFPTTVSTTYLLSVRNNGNPAFSVASNGDVAASGTLFAANATVGTPGTPGDLAERVDIAIDDQVEPGDVMIVDPDTLDTYRKSGQANEQAVAGVISTNPTITVGNGRTDHTAVMAMIGRVPIKVSGENGAVKRGDILVTASKPGHAMRYDPTIDNGVQLIGTVGVALESFDPAGTSTGKIMGLVRSGWMNNRHQTIAELQQNLLEIAEAEGVDIQENPEALQVVEHDGNIGRIEQDLNLNGFYINNVAGLLGTNDAWEIDITGRFITRVETSEGNTSLYALQSQNTEYVFSGSSALINGEKEVVFDQVHQDIIDGDKPMKVSITLTAEANGVYVSKKQATGFTVKELLQGNSNATFDWVVIAERKSGMDKEEQVAEEDPIIPEDVVNPEENLNVVPPPAEENSDEAEAEVPSADSVVDDVSVEEPAPEEPVEDKEQGESPAQDNEDEPIVEPIHDEVVPAENEPQPVEPPVEEGVVIAPEVPAEASQEPEVVAEEVPAPAEPVVALPAADEPQAVPQPIE